MAVSVSCAMIYCDYYYTYFSLYFRYVLGCVTVKELCVCEVMVWLCCPGMVGMAVKIWCVWLLSGYGVAMLPGYGVAMLCMSCIVWYDV